MTDERDDDQPEDGEAPARAPTSAKKSPKRPPPLGAGAPARFQRESNEADNVWSEIISWLPSAGLTPYDVYMQIKRVDPPPPGGGSVPVGRIPGQSVMGGDGEPPGPAFIDWMIRYIHLPTMVGPAKYDVEFRRTSNGDTIAVARESLPDRQTCLAMLGAEEQARLAGGGGQGMGVPPRAAPPAPAPQAGFTGFAPAPQNGWPPPPPGYFGAPPAGPQVPPEMWQMMQTMMGEAFQAAREGRQPAMPQMPQPVGAAAPLDRAVLVQEVTAGVLVALQKAGIGSQPIQATAPPPVQASPGAQSTVSGLAGSVEKMMGGILESVVKTLGANLEKSVKQSMGMGAPPAAEEEAPEVAAEPEKPEDMLPWQSADTGARWGDGRPVHFAKNKETGDIDPMGLIMTNPVIGEKAMAIATGIGEAVQEAIKKFTSGPPTPGQAQVVKQIPSGAVDATVGQPKPDNGGWGAP
jgi:hypothetical protein